MSDPPASHGLPLLRVVRGHPTPEELAALVAVVAASRAGSQAPAVPVRSAWGHPARTVRAPVHPTLDGWRASALPR